MRLKSPKRAVIKTASLPAPTGGLNAKNAIADMPETDAVIMENMFPGTSSVDVRKGYASHSINYPAPVETLMTYNIGASKALFAASGGGIYNASSSGSAGTAVVTSMANDRWQWTTIGTSGGYFLLAVNGANKMRIYDGSTWDYDGGGTYTVTGLDTSTVIGINAFKNRIWLLKNNSLDAYYLAVSSIAGTATKFPLSALFKQGGYLMAMENWTIDNANGIDDYAAFITSEGEVALYKGTDPASADTWALVGTFRMGRPIGRRCAIKVASDVLLNSQDGAFPLSKALLTDRSQAQGAITDKITNLLKKDIADHKSKYGWQPILHPTGNKLIINVPTIEDSEAHQYVMNTINGSWCKFTGWNAVCFAVHDDELYFGGANAVYKADTGTDDNGSDIQTDVQQAFSYFGSKGRSKKFNLARPTFLTDGDLDAALVMNTNYSSRVPVYSASFTAQASTTWDTATWDVDAWAIGDTLLTKWQSITGEGHCGGIRLKTATQGIKVEWVSTDFAYEEGGVL